MCIVRLLRNRHFTSLPTHGVLQTPVLTKSPRCVCSIATMQDAGSEPSSPLGTQAGHRSFFVRSVTASTRNERQRHVCHTKPPRSISSMAAQLACLSPAHAWSVCLRSTQCFHIFWPTFLSLALFDSTHQRLLTSRSRAQLLPIAALCREASVAKAAHSPLYISQLSWLLSIFLRVLWLHS